MLIKRLVTYVLVLFYSVGVFAQLNDFETIMNNGMASYELGNYGEAISFFKQAYQYDKTSNLACYQLALTYLSLREFEDAAIYSGKVISKKGEYLEDAYLVHGSAWESLGRSFRAKKNYQEGLTVFPGSYLLHYNLALLLFDSNEFEEAQAHAISAIEILPAHASSHLLLAYIMFDKGERVKSMLPLYYFLMIEQNSDRSIAAYDLLSTLWDQGVRVKGRRDINLVKAGYNYSEFGEIELAISPVVEAKKTDEKKVYVPGSRLIKFAENSKTLFKTLSESSTDKDGFWGEFYMNFLSNIENNDISESFSYFISSCKYNEDVVSWISNHSKDFQRFTVWMNDN